MNVARKMAVVDAVNHALSQRIDAAVWTLDGLTESRNTASKSTAGDKHETGRAMMEAEIQRAEQQLQKARVLRNEVKIRRLHLDGGSTTSVSTKVIVENAREPYVLGLFFFAMNRRQNKGLSLSRFTKSFIRIY